LLALHPFRGIPIPTPAAFLALVEPPTAEPAAEPPTS
jgi:hypothetical protein